MCRIALLLEPVGAVADCNAVGDRILDEVGGVRRVEERDQQTSVRQPKHEYKISTVQCAIYEYSQGFPDRGPRAQIWAPDRLFLGPLGLKYMH